MSSIIHFLKNLFRVNESESQPILTMEEPLKEPKKESSVRYLRSGLKSVDSKDGKRREAETSKNKCSDKPTIRLRITKETLNDKKLFLPQTVAVQRLSPNRIRKYDRKFFHKYAKKLKEEQNLIKYSKIKQILTKKEAKIKKIVVPCESPKRMLLWTNPNPQSIPNTNHPVLRSHPSYLKHWTKYDERENSLMTSAEFCRNLNLISKKDLNRMNDRQLKTTFSLRNISKCDDFTTNDKNEVEVDPNFLLQNLDTHKPSSSSLQLTKKGSKKDSNKKKNKTHLWTANKVKEKYQKLEKQKKKKLKHFKEQYLKCLSSFDMSSPMGRRMLVAFKTQELDPSKVQTMIRKYDEHSTTKIRFKTKEPNELCKWKTHRIERFCTSLELSQKDRDINNFQYSFTRRQRLDRWQRMITGIEWKSRLLAMHCNAKVLVRRCYDCPICQTTIQTDHSCDINAPPKSSPERRNTEKPNSNQNSLKSSSKRKKINNCTLSEEKRNRKARSPNKQVERVCQINLDKQVIFVDLSDDE